MSVNKWFRIFHNSVYFKGDMVATIQNRRQAVSRRINREYWNITSSTSNSLYTGSYGRSTEITSSDIDLIVKLPWCVKNRFDNRVGNVQSQLLSEVKDKLKLIYSSSHLKSDGQVIVINFSDDIKFEIIPVFEYSDGLFCYPDTNSGRSWKLMNPVLEMDAFNLRNRLNNKTMKKFCRMIRVWRNENDVDISGELIDTIVYAFYSEANYIEKDPYLYFDFITRDFFKYISDNIHNIWFTPGTSRILKLKYPYLTYDKTTKSFEDSLKAIKYESDYPYLAKSSWRDIYGSKF